jgi:protein-S-isoprenylcysteine O-methyltransferase Ste14
LPGALLGCAWLTEQWAPLPISGNDALFLPGIVLLLASLALVALFQFFRAKTHIEPWQPTSVIIESGVFRYSRNPIYLAYCIAMLGGGLLLDSWWGIVAIAPLAGLLQVLVIRKEETYLETKFGDSYLDYKRRVRRWL